MHGVDAKSSHHRAVEVYVRMGRGAVGSVLKAGVEPSGHMEHIRAAVVSRVLTEFAPEEHHGVGEHVGLDGAVGRAS